MTDAVQIRHVVPVSGDHKADPFCWCQPVYEDLLPSGRIFIHRRYLDGSAREKPATVKSEAEAQP